jgi:hypothetical protein
MVVVVVPLLLLTDLCFEPAALAHYKRRHRAAALQLNFSQAIT